MIMAGAKLVRADGAVPITEIPKAGAHLHRCQHQSGIELLAEMTKRAGEDFSRLKIDVTPKGKPYFANSRLYFNLSHAGAVAVCALSDREVGIDVEPYRLIRRALCRRFLDGAPESDALIEWTRREAYGKMTGEGFFFDAKNTFPHLMREYELTCQDRRYIVSLCMALYSSSPGSQSLQAASGTGGLVTADAELPEQITWY